MLVQLISTNGSQVVEKISKYFMQIKFYKVYFYMFQLQKQRDEDGVVVHNLPCGGARLPVHPGRGGGHGTAG